MLANQVFPLHVLWPCVGVTCKKVGLKQSHHMTIMPTVISTYIASEVFQDIVSGHGFKTLASCWPHLSVNQCC